MSRIAKVWRFIRVLAVAALFVALVLAAGACISLDSVLPTVISGDRTGTDQGSASQALTGISSAMITLDAALSAAAVILLRMRTKLAPDGVDWLVAGGIVCLSAVSIFSAYRFHIDVATQLAVDHLEIARVLGALEAQASTLLAGTGLLVGLGVDRIHQLHRDGGGAE